MKVAKTTDDKELIARVSSLTKSLVTFKNEQFAKHGGLKDKVAEDKAAHLEQRINETVFALYGLDRSEIELVEAAQL